MDAPILNLYSIQSGEYSVRRDKWNNVNLEIYYHAGHEFDLDTMMESMKETLAYCSANYSPFQFHQLRIIEFPGYGTFAESFANTIPYSESIGFITKVRDQPDAVNNGFGSLVTVPSTSANSKIGENTSTTAGSLGLSLLDPRQMTLSARFNF